MKTLAPYLVFPGNCRAAMEFYAQILGGEIKIMQPFAEAPFDVPENLGHRIFNSELQADGIIIKASDDLPSHPVNQGNHMSLYISFENEQKKIDVFEKMAKDGKVLFPITDNFGMLKDQYGVQWMMVHH